MKGKAIHVFTAALIAMFCVVVVSVTAYAGSVDPHPQPSPEETEEPTIRGIEMESEDVPVTPKGNAALVNDFLGDKQLVTVTTETGNYFYILIDRANEGKETAVYLLNQVGGADLQTLLKDGETKSEHCTCTTKYEAGAVNTNCPVCKNNMDTCTRLKPEEHKSEEARPQEEKPNGISGLVVFLAVVLTGGGAAPYSFKFRRPKVDIKGSSGLDEYNFGENEGDEGEALEPDDTQKLGKDWLTKRGASEPNKEDERWVFN